jgi:hypothetical protein
MNETARGSPRVTSTACARHALATHTGMIQLLIGGFMSSVVIELQQEALNSSQRASDLLRKALVVARKLEIEEFEEWIDCELNGYRGQKEIPDYRIVTGKLQVFNPYRGWIPLNITDPQVARELAEQPLDLRIKQIEIEVEASKVDNPIRMGFRPEFDARLRGLMEMPWQISLAVSSSELNGILDAVRNIMLNWSLKLERDGILGEGLVFTEKEKTLAAQRIYTVNNFYGSVSRSQFQQDSTNSSQSMIIGGMSNNEVGDLLEKLAVAVQKMKKTLPPETAEEVQRDLNTLTAEIASKTPRKRWWQISMEGLKKAANDVGEVGKPVLELAA